MVYFLPSPLGRIFWKSPSSLCNALDMAAALSFAHSIWELMDFSIFPEFDSYFWAKARPALSLSPKNFYRQCSLNVALYDIIKSISVLEGDNASARFNRFG